jgi:hypothetical protein
LPNIVLTAAMHIPLSLRVKNSRQTMTALAAAFFGSSRRGIFRTDSPAKMVAERHGIIDDPVWFLRAGRFGASVPLPAFGHRAQLSRLPQPPPARPW